MAKKKTSESKNSAANIGFEAKLWLAADKLRNNMDAAEYKHVVLGLINRPTESPGRVRRRLCEQRMRFFSVQTWKQWCEQQKVALGNFPEFTNVARYTLIAHPMLKAAYLPGIAWRKMGSVAVTD